MPRLPEYVAREALPATGGVPRSTVSVPVVAQPQADATAATLLERGLEQVGTAAQQGAETLVRAETLAGQRQKAQDVLDARTRLQDYRQQLGPKYEALLQGDYRTLPEDILREGTQLIQELGESLSPQGRALFTEDAKQALTVMQYKGIEERTRRRDQSTVFAVEQEIAHFQDAYARATTPFERAYHRESLVSLVNAFADTGLGKPAELADLLTKTLRAGEVQDVRIAMQANPEAMRAQLLAQTRGDPTREDLPLAPREHLAALTREASTIYRERMMEQEHTEQYLDRRLVKLQAQIAIDLRARVTELAPEPANLPQYDVLLREVNARARERGIRESEQTELTGLLRTLRATALNPPQADDPATERHLALLLNAAENPRDFADLRTQIIEAAPRLKVDTWKGLLAQAKERERADHWSNLPGVRAGRQTIIGGDVSESSMLAMMRGPMEEAEKIRLRTALDVYTTQVQAIAETSTTRANAEAPGLALEIRRAYVDQPSQEAKNRGLPPALQSVTEPSIAADVIRQLPGTRAEKGRLWRRWQEAQPPPRPPAGQAPPAPGTRPRAVPPPVTPETP